MATTATVTVRNFTGKAIALDIDPASKILDVKHAIARAMGKLPAGPLTLTWRGHELRDHQRLSHYGVQAGSGAPTVLHILPPSKAPKTPLQFEKPDGSHFSLHVNADATVAQLKREVALEERLDVHALKFVFSRDDPDDPDALLVSEPDDLPDDAVISHYPMADATIFICGLPPPATPPPSFDVCVLLDDGRRLAVQVRLQQTLAEFRDAVRLQHGVPITDDVLILVGREVTGDDMPVWDLGFVPNCVVHAVPFMSITVEIIAVEAFGTLLLHPLTRLSAIRRILEQDAPAHVSMDRYRFTLDGMGHLSESRRLWDLDLVSGAVLHMRTSELAFTVTTLSGTHRVDADEGETVLGLKERVALVAGYVVDFTELRLMYRGKVLQDGRTVREEGLVGGETLSCLGGATESEWRFGGGGAGSRPGSPGKDVEDALDKEEEEEEEEEKKQL